MNEECCSGAEEELLAAQVLVRASSAEWARGGLAGGTASALIRVGETRVKPELWPTNANEDEDEAIEVACGTCVCVGPSVNMTSCPNSEPSASLSENCFAGD